jgi:hypothetical protein
MMQTNIAIVRQHVSRIPGVTRTWFEWISEGSPPSLAKTLVVEVDFDTDPNSPDWRREVLNAIADTVKAVQEETTMIFSYLRIVPRLR